MHKKLYTFRFNNYSTSEFIKRRTFYMNNPKFPDKHYSVVCGRRNVDNQLELMRVDSADDVHTRYRVPFVLYFAEDHSTEYAKAKKLYDTPFTNEVGEIASQSENLEDSTKKLFE